MTHRERILSVYKGDKPDQIPFMLDLSHWFYHKHKMKWDLSHSYNEVEKKLIDYHKENDIGFYMPNSANFFQTKYAADVIPSVEKKLVSNESEICWSYKTPLGVISRTRQWNENSYSWHITNWGVSTKKDVEILMYALKNRSFHSDWKDWNNWNNYVAETGVVYIGPGYSAIGQLLNYWMGIENTIFATYDFPELMKEFAESVNENNLKIIDLLCESPAEVIIMGDNFSSDVQPPEFFKAWSHDYYTEAARRLHAAGKYLSVHIDGKLKGAIEMIKNTGADCGDAITPAPMGDLEAHECREEAGNDFILSGGISPDLWVDEDDSKFETAAKKWLELKTKSFRMICNAGDQVPPETPEYRIKMFKELVLEYGQLN